MDRETLEPLIESIAKSVGIDPKLALAIAWVESGIDTTKVRYEPAWSYFVSPTTYSVPLGITEATEKILQAMSWSCLQVMGSNARALGYVGQLTLLVQPSLGILYGCKMLKSLSNKLAGNERDIISAYNGGIGAKEGSIYRNQGYVDLVGARLKTLRS